MKILSIHPQQRDLRVIIKLEKGKKVELVKIGSQLACLLPPEGLNKESKNYIALKKACVNSEYFTSDLHLKNRQIRHIKELKQMLKIFINTEL